MALALRFPNAATSNQRRQVIFPGQGAVLGTAAAVPLPQITGLPGGGPFASDCFLQYPKGLT